MNAPAMHIPSTLQALETLARGLAQDANLQVALTESTWSWNLETRTLSVAASSLATMPLHAAAGIVAHEIGHAALSLPSGPPRLVELTQWAWHHVVNCFEDTRVESWAMQRWPAARDWLAAARRDLGDPDSSVLESIPAGLVLERFLLACLEEWHRDWHPDPHLEPALQHDLAQTRAVRQQLTTFLPEATPDHVLQPTLVAQAFDAMLTALTSELGEVLVRRFRAQREALAVQLAHEPEEARAARQLLVDAKEAAADPERFIGIVLVARTQIHRLLARPAVVTPGLPADLLALADRLAALSRAQPQPRAVQAALTRSGAPRQPARPAPPPPPAPLQPTQLPLAQQRATLLAGLRRQLAEAFPPLSPSGWQPGYRSGAKLLLREAIAAEADPRRWAGAFARRRARKGPDAAVLLLVDLSGSMGRDGKIDAAVVATLACTEALLELGVDTAVYGFQDRLIPMVPFGTGWTASVARSISAMVQEVHGQRRGGNNHPSANDDGPCLRDAAAILRQQPAARRVLLVLSDGFPTEPTPRIGAVRLHDAVQAVTADRQLTLVGLGLGEGTAHVEEFYPDGMGNIAVSAFPKVLSRTLVKRLRLGTVRA